MRIPDVIIQCFSSSEYIPYGTRTRSCLRLYWPSFRWILYPHRILGLWLMHQSGCRHCIHRHRLRSFWQCTVYAVPSVSLSFSLCLVPTVQTSAIPGITGCYQTSGSSELFIPFVLLVVNELGVLEQPAANNFSMTYALQHSPSSHSYALYRAGRRQEILCTLSSWSITSSTMHVVSVRLHTYMLDTFLLNDHSKSSLCWIPSRRYSSQYVIHPGLQRLVIDIPHTQDGYNGMFREYAFANPAVYVC